MPSAYSMIQFKYGLAANYAAIEQKDVNTVYFTTDTQQLYVGDIEYSRPVYHGTSLPVQFLPPNSIFVLEADSNRTLYYSKDGAEWDKISILPPSVTGGVFGNNTKSTLSFGGSINIPKITVDSNGFVTSAEDINLTLPTETKLTVASSGAGNAITSVSVDSTGHKLSVTKGSTFMPASGGAFTGPITVAAPTADTNPATKKYVDDAIGKVTQFECSVVTSLPTTGVKGVIYLIAHTHGDKDIYDEYIWVSNKFEKIGNTDIDLSKYATTSDVTTKLATKVNTSTTINGVKLDSSAVTIPVGASNLVDLNDVSITTPTDGQAVVYQSSTKKYIAKTLDKSSVGLGNVDNTADAAKSVASAAKLKTSRTIALSGGVTGTATAFDGSANITIPVTSVQGDKVTGSVKSATSATNDSAGNNIAKTYATKSELNSSLTWRTF